MFTNIQIATGYVTNGAKVYIASRDAKSIAASAARLTAMGPGQCIGLVADLSKYDDCVRLAKEIEKREEGEFTATGAGGWWERRWRGD
jgi:short-subunit dehydrogenase